MQTSLSIQGGPKKTERTSPTLRLKPPVPMDGEYLYKKYGTKISRFGLVLVFIALNKAIELLRYSADGHDSKENEGLETCLSTWKDWKLVYIL